MVGTWTVVSSCVREQQTTKGACAAAAYSSNITFDGTVIVNADMTLASSLSETITQEATGPVACLAANASTCAEVQQVDQGNATATDSSATAICTQASGDTCTCTVTGTEATAAGTGTYTTSGNVITVTGTALAGSYTYCVSTGNYLTITPQGTTNTNGTVSFTGSVVLEKQASSSTSTGTSTGTSAGVCNLTTDSHSCVIFTDMSATEAQAICDNADGTLVSSCPTANEIGTCVATTNGVATTSVYYSDDGTTVSGAEEACLIGDGTWSPN